MDGFVSLISAFSAQAQFDEHEEKVTIGFGLGVDYGGLGGRAAFERDINRYRSMGVVIPDPLPVSISVGYHIGI